MARAQGALGRLLAAIIAWLGDGDSTAGIEMRRDPRHEIGEPVEVETAGGVWRADLLELSASGARIRLLEGWWPSVNEELTIRLCDARFLCGQVAWVSEKAIGVRLIGRLSCVEEYRWIEARGADWMRRTARMRATR